MGEAEISETEKTETKAIEQETTSTEVDDSAEGMEVEEKNIADVEIEKETVELVCGKDEEKRETDANEKAEPSAAVETATETNEIVEEGNDLENNQEAKAEMTEEERKELVKKRKQMKKEEENSVKAMKISELRDLIREHGKTPVGKVKKPLVDLALKCVRAKYGKNGALAINFSTL